MAPMNTIGEIRVPGSPRTFPEGPLPGQHPSLTHSAPNGSPIHDNDLQCPGWEYLEKHNPDVSDHPVSGRGLPISPNPRTARISSYVANVAGSIPVGELHS